jgi:hypothetical protein
MQSSVVAGLHEQTDTPCLQRQKLARVQASAQAPWIAVDRCGSRGAGLSISADEPEPNDRCCVLHMSINDKKGTST